MAECVVIVDTYDGPVRGEAQIDNIFRDHKRNSEYSILFRQAYHGIEQAA